MFPVAIAAISTSAEPDSVTVGVMQLFEQDAFVVPVGAVSLATPPAELVRATTTTVHVLEGLPLRVQEMEVTPAVAETFWAPATTPVEELSHALFDAVQVPAPVQLEMLRVEEAGTYAMAARESPNVVAVTFTAQVVEAPEHAVFVPSVPRSVQVAQLGKEQAINAITSSSFLMLVRLHR